MSFVRTNEPRPLTRAERAPRRPWLGFPAVLCGLLCLLAVATVRERLDDPDMWWHMKVGQIIWSTHIITTADTFSCTTGHHRWIPHEWLSQLTIYLAYAAGGLAGAMGWLCLGTAALLVAAFALCTLHSGSTRAGFLGALVIWLCATIGLAVRPQLIGYLLLVLEMILLPQGRYRDRRWLLGLPPPVRALGQLPRLVLPWRPGPPLLRCDQPRPLCPGPESSPFPGSGGHGTC